MLSSRERRDAHNTEVDTRLALVGRCGHVHLATGRVCVRPERHRGACDFVLRQEALAQAGVDSAVPGVLEDLTATECWDLVTGHGMGRFVFLEGRGPVAVPVNYAASANSHVVFRTDPKGPVALRAGQVRVALEVDSFDEERRAGWSVLISGRAHTITDRDELAQAKGMGIHPWAGGRRDLYVQLDAEEISGRRVAGGRN